MNSVNIVGRLTKDPVLRKTGNGVSVVSFTIACDRRIKTEGQPTADFINCISWNKLADNIVQYVHKGFLVGIEGRIQTRSYDDKKGKRIYVTEVVAEKIDFLESKKKEEFMGYGHEEEWSQQEKELEEYAKKHPDDPYVQGSYGSTLDIQSDDLPF